MSPKELRARRLELGISITDLAQRLNLPAKTVTAWERGDAPLDAAATIALRNAPEKIRQALLREAHGNA